MGLYEELEQRGLLAQCTNSEKVREMLNNEKVTFYIGFDPTADSLHVGHFLQMVVMAHMQKAGHHPIALFGGGTAMVGDPSGRTDMRSMMTVETIQHNVDCFVKQFGRFIDFSDNKATMVNNADWLLNLNYVEFLRDVGVHFSVNRMLTAECFKSRLERGLSFLEFNYMLMQSYDFLMLNREYGCKIELGGDDQWSNILGGIELCRRKDQTQTYGMTFTLLTTSEGKKMGKTAKGALWLDKEKCSPFDFYQYWVNVQDDDVINCLKLITFVPMEEINEMAKWEGAELNKAKKRLAYEVTKLVHGEEEAQKAQNAAKSIFGAGGDENMPTATISKDDLRDGTIDILTILVKAELVPSRSEARRAVEQGGVTVNGEKVTDIKTTYNETDLTDGLVVRRGKKAFKKVTL